MEDVFFKDKTAKILIVGGSSTVRNMHRDILKSYGYTNSVTVNDLAGAIEVLEMDIVNWMITPIALEEKISAFQLLKLSLSHPRLKDLHISFLLKEGEDTVLGAGFDLGLLSFMYDRTTRNELEEEYSQFFSALQRSAWNMAKVASCYIHDILTNEPEELMSFTRRFLEIFPGEADTLIQLAEAQFLNQHKEAGLQTLKQAMTIDPSTKEACQELATKYGDIADSGEALQEQNTLSISGCLILEEDRETTSQLVGILQELGVPKVEVHSDPEQAIAYLKQNSDIGLVICEWALSKLPGPVFVQRVRQVTHMVTAPILVCNAKVEESDLPILHELGALSYIKKPVVKDECLKKIIWTLQQQRLPTEPGTLEFTIRQHLGRGEVDKAKGLFGKLLKSKDLGEVQKIRLQAEFSYLEGKYAVACDLCLEAIKHGEHNVFIFSLLGKSLIKSRDIQAALRCLDLAQSLSPMSVERICEISECHMSNEDFDQAQQAIDMAEELDPEADRIRESKAKLALVQGDGKTARALLGEVGRLREVVGFMNNRAVSLTLNQRIGEAVELYQQAIDSLPEGKGELTVLVKYNLALSFARDGKLKQSLATLKESLGTPEGKRNMKTRSLYARLNKALKSGDELVLNTNDPSEKDAAQSIVDDESFINLITLKPGEMRCHKIYVASTYPPEVTKSINGKLTFNPRKIITKDQALSK